MPCSCPSPRPSPRKHGGEGEVGANVLSENWNPWPPSRGTCFSVKHSKNQARRAWARGFLIGDLEDAAQQAQISRRGHILELHDHVGHVFGTFNRRWVGRDSLWLLLAIRTTF